MTATTQPTVRNGVDTAALFSTLEAVKQQPEIATFRFSARNTWVSGTHPGEPAPLRRLWTQRGEASQSPPR